MKFTNEGWKYKTSKKEKAFEYFVSKIVQWWIEENPTVPFEKNDLSRLKVMKLLFLVIAKNTKLLGVFNNWYAMPYGHIEKDIQDLIQYRNGDFKDFKITHRKIYLK